MPDDRTDPSKPSLGRTRQGGGNVTAPRAGTAGRRSVVATLAALGLARFDRPALAKKKRPRPQCVKPTATLAKTLAKAKPGSTVTLCAGTFPGLLGIGTDLTLAGAGAGQTVLDGQGRAPVLLVSGGATVTVSDLTVTGGHDASGGGPGGVLNRGTLTLLRCTVRGNRTDLGSGGGIANSTNASLTIDGTSVAGNTADIGGGGIDNVGTLVVRGGSVIGGSGADGNVVSYSGGGLSNAGTASFEAGTKVVGNKAIASGTADGGGIFTYTGGQTTLAATAIVAGNSPNNCGGVSTANCSG